MSYNQSADDQFGKRSQLGETGTQSGVYGDNSDVGRNATSNTGAGRRAADDTNLDRDNASFGNNNAGLGRDTGLGSTGGMGSTDFSQTGTNSGTGIHAQQYRGRDDIGTGTGTGTGIGTGTGMGTGTDASGQAHGHHVGGHHLRHGDTAERHTRPTETGVQDNNCQRAGCTDRTHGHYLSSEPKVQNVGTGVGTGSGATGLNQGGGVTDSYAHEGRMGSDEYRQTGTTYAGDAGSHAGNKHGTHSTATGTKPSAMDKVVGGAEKMAGKVTSNPAMVAKGEGRAARGENVSRN